MKKSTELLLARDQPQKTVYPILFSISFAHMLNDMLQSVIPSVYPMLKDNYQLNFTQIGVITLVFQLTASLLQPLVGMYTDKNPRPFSLAVGMVFSLIGLMVLSRAPNFAIILFSVGLVGVGSSIFHPESSRVAYMASGGQRGLAQSIFQIGGNAGSAIGPLLAALLIIPYGQTNILWFGIAAVLAIFALLKVGRWYRDYLQARNRNKDSADSIDLSGMKVSKSRISFAIVILLILIFSKYFYMACMSSYFTFFLIEKFGVTIQQSQVYLFVFLAAVAAGTFMGGPLGDRFGRKYVIWISILGAAPFALLLPHVSLFWVVVLSIIIGIILSSAFSAILVYAQELMPGKVGMISGLFFGFAFGMGGIGSAVLGNLADSTSIEYVFWLCGFLPLLGIVTGFLPNIRQAH
ncbi:MFS transporter [Membranihabitans maritimus]|uniref:MFS transporter n=1 Tax=Membranihabitans maritimus TaxID=2904244 RepID=UPI001F3D7CE9|nr:MFS transporter [Membranihabitans maritimus]